MARHELLLLHASRAAVDPVAEFYLRVAPELRPVNVLDEGVMGKLREKDWGGAVRGLRGQMAVAREEYGVRGVLVTCSAIGPEAMEAVREGAGMGVIKIDEPMLGMARGKVGLVATFASTAETSRDWIRHLRPDAEVETVLDTGALEALLRGDVDEHDRRLLAAAEDVAGRGIGQILLAQVSMARLAERIRKRTGLEVLESLGSSLAGVRRMMNESS